MIWRPPGGAIAAPVTSGRMEVPLPPPKELEKLGEVSGNGQPIVISKETANGKATQHRRQPSLVYKRLANSERQLILSAQANHVCQILSGDRPVAAGAVIVLKLIAD